MLKNKPVTIAVNTSYRLLSLPMPVTPEVFNIVKNVVGVSEAIEAGKYEITFIIGRCFDIQLIDNNVKFAVEEYMKK